MYNILDGIITKISVILTHLKLWVEISDISDNYGAPRVYVSEERFGMWGNGNSD